MGYLNQDQLEGMKFRSLGNNHRISDKASIYNAEQMEIGDCSRIDDFCVVSGKVVIGRNVHTAIFCNVAGDEKGVHLHDFSGLADGCHVITQSDDYTGKTLTNPTVPDEHKREHKAAVIVGKHSIVGTGSVVLPGVVVADGAAIGALSVVTKSTGAWSVYFGAPVKRIKAHSKDLLDLEAAYLQNEKTRITS
jgi:galactoside O-acetyltransferase